MTTLETLVAIRPKRQFLMPGKNPRAISPILSHTISPDTFSPSFQSAIRMLTIAPIGVARMHKIVTNPDDFGLSHLRLFIAGPSCPIGCDLHCCIFLISCNVRAVARRCRASRAKRTSELVRRCHPRLMRLVGLAAVIGDYR